MYPQSNVKYVKTVTTITNPLGKINFMYTQK